MRSQWNGEAPTGKSEFEFVFVSCVRARRSCAGVCQRGGIGQRSCPALATAGSFLSPARAASPCPHARHEPETKTDFPVGGSSFHCDLTPQPPILQN